MHRVFDSAASVGASPYCGRDDVAFSTSGRDRHTEVMMSEFKSGTGVSPVNHGRDGHATSVRTEGHTRDVTVASAGVRGQSDWLTLLCRTLSFLIPSRFSPALSLTPILF